MNQFVQRIANYVANEIIIKGLANSKTFQRFALRTQSKYEKVSKTAAEQFEQAVQQQQHQQGSAAATQSGPPQPPLTGFPGFIAAFFKEIRKDITGS